MVEKICHTISTHSVVKTINAHKPSHNIQKKTEHAPGPDDSVTAEVCLLEISERL